MSVITALSIPTTTGSLTGDLDASNAPALIVFAHGSGSSRMSPRNRRVAARLREGGLGTLLMDLLTPDEAAEDERSGRWRFDIDLLARRLVDTIDWLGRDPLGHDLPLGLFGASTGAAAALIAAGERPEAVRAVVSRGGRADLAGDALEQVHAPTLFVVGAADREVLALNRAAAARLGTPDRAIEVVPGADHLFTQPGTLDRAAVLARDWFLRWC